MPRTRSRIPTAEEEHRARLLRLEQIGIATGDAANLPTKPDRLILEQIDPELARVYDLPNGEVAVVVLAKATVLQSGVMITKQQMTLAWNDYPLELRGPSEHQSFQNLIQALPWYPPIILNDYLVERPLPLHRCQFEGVIIAIGWSSVPATYRDETLVSMELSLWDEQGHEIYCEFTGRVDRSIMRKYERQQQKRRALAPLPKRTGLYGPLEASVGNQRGTSQKLAIDTKREAIGASHPSGLNSPRYQGNISFNDTIVPEDSATSSKEA